MKKALSVLTVVIIASCLFASQWEVGETGPAGGIVFHSWSEGSSLHYLEASQAFEAEGLCSSVALPVATDSFIGSGLSNSLLLLEAEAKGAASAISTASEATVGSMDDWYIPSLDELKKLYEVIGSLYEKQGYWSSTEASTAFAYGLDFTDGTEFASTKWTPNAFIAVRESVVEEAAGSHDVSVSVVSEGSNVQISQVTDRIMITGQILPEDFSFVNKVSFLTNTVNYAIDFINTLAMVDSDYAASIPLSEEVNSMITAANNFLWSDLQEGLQLMTEYLAYIYGVGEAPVLSEPFNPVDVSLLKEDQWYTSALIAFKQIYTAISEATAQDFETLDINDYLIAQQDALYNAYNELFNGLYTQMMEAYSAFEWAPEPEVEPTRYLMFLCLNNQDEILADPAIRKILFWGADRQAIINAALGEESTGKPAWSLNYDEASELSNDMDKAKAYIAQAAQLPTLDFLYLSDSQEGLAQTVGNIITSTTGISFNYVGVTSEEYYKALEAGSYDVALFLTDLTQKGFLEGTFESSSTYNFGHVQDEAYDAIIAEAAMAQDAQQQEKLYKQASDHLLEAAALVPLFFFY